MNKLVFPSVSAICLILLVVFLLSKLWILLWIAIAMAVLLAGYYFVKREMKPKESYDTHPASWN